MAKRLTGVGNNKTTRSKKTASRLKKKYEALKERLEKKHPRFIKGK